MTTETMTAAPTTRPRPAPKRSFRTLLSRLAEAGFTRRFVELAVLPDWWSPDCDKDPNMLADAEFRVARFLGCSLADVRNPERSFSVPAPEGVQFRHAAGRQTLLAAMHSGLAVARAVERNLRNMPAYQAPPADPLAWRAELLASAASEAITLRRLARELWRRGIPVVHCPRLPKGKFRAMACRLNERPCILLAWGGGQQPSLLWDLAHETGHIALGHVSRSGVSIDDSDDLSPPCEPSPPDRALEAEANRFAKLLLAGDIEPEVCDSAASAEEVKRRARYLGKTHRVDTGLLALWWGTRTGQNATATVAIGRLKKTHGDRVLAEPLLEHLDTSDISETDQALLQCLAIGVGDAPA